MINSTSFFIYTWQISRSCFPSSINSLLIFYNISFCFSYQHIELLKSLWYTMANETSGYFLLMYILSHRYRKKNVVPFFQSCLFYLSCIWPCLHVQSPEAKIWRKLSLFQSMSHQPHAQAQGSGSDVLLCLCHGSGGRQSLELRIT